MELENVPFRWHNILPSTYTNSHIIEATTPFSNGSELIKSLVRENVLKTMTFGLEMFCRNTLSVSGVSHVDEISFLFADSYSLAPEFQKDSVSETVSKNFVRLWTSFPANG